MSLLRVVVDDDALRELVREVIGEMGVQCQEPPVRAEDLALLTAEEVEEKTQIPLQTIYEIVRRGALKVVRINKRHFLISPRALRDFIEAGGLSFSDESDQASAEPPKLSLAGKR